MTLDATVTTNLVSYFNLDKTGLWQEILLNVKMNLKAEWEKHLQLKRTNDSGEISDCNTSLGRFNLYNIVVSVFYTSIGQKVAGFSF